MSYLTLEDQGLWYTFISLGALTMLVDLGFTSIITQFISHEFAHLTFENGKLTGKEKRLNSIFSLIHYSIKFYSYIVLFASILLVLFGIYYFRSEKISVFFLWLLFSISSSLSLYSSLLLSIFQGLDNFKETQKIILFSSILMTVCIWLMLFFDFSILALAIGNLINIFLQLIFSYARAPIFWRQVMQYKIVEKVNWASSIKSLQIKYGFSLFSGYIIFYLFTPVLNNYFGSAIAGQYGMSMSLVSSISLLAGGWVVSSIPKYNILVSQKKYLELRDLFTKSVFSAILVHVLTSLILVVGIYFILIHTKYENRILSVENVIVLLFISFIQSLINYLAIYLRSFKEEPFFLLSIFNALLVLFILFFVLPNFGLLTMLLVNAGLLSFLILPLSINIFLKKLHAQQSF